MALVVERPLGLGVPELTVPSARAAMGPIAARFYGDPTSELRVVGVTGTNGKTTTAYLVRALLEAAGDHCGLLGTVKSVVGGEERVLARTTPEAIDLQADFRAMLDGGDRAARWRSPRMRLSSGAPTRSASPPRSSRTSRRTISTSTTRWRTTSRPSAACSGRGPRV